MSLNLHNISPILQNRGPELLIRHRTAKPVIAGHALARLYIQTNPISLTHDLLMNSLYPLISSLKNS